MLVVFFDSAIHLPLSNAFSTEVRRSEMRRLSLKEKVVFKRSRRLLLWRRV